MNQASRHRSRLQSAWVLPLLAALAGCPIALANPTGGTVTQGSANFSSVGSKFTIKQTSGRAFVNWSSFNIGAGETTTFVQPSSSSVIWNKINDANPSQILGNLNANGYVVLQNSSGFVVGGEAAITAHGLVMTTASTPNLNLSSGGSWEFAAPPPSAQIINYGRINITGGGSAYLIASDIQNANDGTHVGTISAPGGSIGLYAGQKVLVSMSPDGRGLSSQVTLPQGSVDNQGKLIADAGSIAAQAQFVNQGGLIQANSVQYNNGVIELVASDNLTLGSSSQISAQGDSTGKSAGGIVHLESGNSFQDQAGSIINVSGGAQGGAAGRIEISAPQMSAIQSSLIAGANSGYANGTLKIESADITVNSDGSLVSGALALNANDFFDGFSHINFQAANDLDLASLWNLTMKPGILATVSLFAGHTLTVEDGSGIKIDAGKITLKGNTVNQNGQLLANSVNGFNGVVEISAANDLNLSAGSSISAAGDGTSASASPGGFVILHSGNSFADTPGSSIKVAGAKSGAGGFVEVFGNNVTDASSIKSTINGISASSFSSQNRLFINPGDLRFSTQATAPASGIVKISDLAAFSQVDFMALHDIILSSTLTLGSRSSEAALNLTAGNNITLNSSITDTTTGNKWGVNFTAGTGSAPDDGGIRLIGGSVIQTQTGNINLWALSDVIVNSGAVRTLGGGNIDVIAESGSVNSGTGKGGFTFGLGRNTAGPYYQVNSSTLGGISTAGGGDVTITAGKDVISFLPTQNAAGTYANTDAGTGAFGAQPGNVSITAGQNVYGHYVLANGIGTVTAGQNVGAPLSVLVGNPQNGFALSLIDGSWDVAAPNGSIYVQDVRNPNGIFGERRNFSAANYNGYHQFDYDPSASVSFFAGGSLEIIGNANVDAPHYPDTDPTSFIPIILPPSLAVTTVSGNFVLDDAITLYPSTLQNLNLNIGGDFLGVSSGGVINLIMSDSGRSGWTKLGDFGVDDHATTPPGLNNPNRVEIAVAGSVEDVNLYTTKAAEITAGGDMKNFGFVGQNLHADDVTVIDVAGKIYNSPLYSFAQLTAPITSANKLQSSKWDSVFYLAVDPDLIKSIAQDDVLKAAGADGLVKFLRNYMLFPSNEGDSVNFGSNPGFIYDPSSKQLGFAGNLDARTSDKQLAALEKGSFTVLVADKQGNPILDSKNRLQFATYNFSAASAIPTLLAGSADANTTAELGFQIGGPGQFDIHAGSMDLGNSPGITSFGFGGRYGSLQPYTGKAGFGGAGISLKVDGDVNMITSAISSIDGGAVDVDVGGALKLSQGNFDFRTSQCFGIYTSGYSSVNVTADGNIDIGSGCIAAFNGGDVNVTSLFGDVNAGNGANKALFIYAILPGKGGGKPTFGTIGNLADPEALRADPAPYGSGILAEYPTPKYFLAGGYRQPGNITVQTPNGNIVSSRGGISQFALNGSIAGGPVVTLNAGTPGVPATPDQGNILLGQGGVVGGTINITAQGDVKGLIVSRQSANINVAQSFSGTVLSGGSANFSGGGSVAGTVVGIGGVSVSGGANVTATVLSQNVSIGNGAAVSTLATSANATGAAQSAAQQSNTEAKQQLASDDGSADDNTKKKGAATLKVKRVTVMLPKAS